MSAPAAEGIVFALERLDLPTLHAWWIDLEARANVAFFLSWSWIGAWLEEAGPPDFVLVGRSGGEIVCLGLFRRGVQRRHGILRSRTLCLHETGTPERDVIVIEYNGLLTDRRYGRLEPQAISFLRANQAAAGGFDELQLGGVAEDCYQALRAAGSKIYIQSRKTTAFVDLAQVRETGDYLASISSNTRYQIRRALKIYEARGPLSLEPARSTEEALAFFDALGELHERAWRQRGEGGAWRYPFLVAFHRRMIETSFPAGGIDIVRISCGDEVIGYIHCLVKGGWIGSYLSGFAYEADNKVKPGLVSFYLYIEHRLKTSGEVFDFLAGDHRYKMSLGQPGTNMYWLRVQEDRWQLRFEDALRSVKHRIETLRRNKAPLPSH